MSYLKFFLLAGLCAAGFSVRAQSADDKQIEEYFRQSAAAWNSGNIDAYMEFYAPLDSVRIIYSAGVVYGKDSIRAFYKKNWPPEKMGQLKFDQVRYERIAEDYYFVSGQFNVLLPGDRLVRGRFSGLMRKLNGKWYIYTDHS